MSRTTIVILGALSMVAFAGCGERPQVITYKQGTYQGKPDTPPYSNPPFNGNQAEWEKTLTARNQSQNEYKRVR